MSLKNLLLKCVEPTWQLASAFNPKAGRAMAPGEIALAKSIFGDSIDYSRVRVCRKISESSAIATALKNHIFVPPGWDQTGDISAQSDNNIQDALRKGVFLHEMTHVWQDGKSLMWVFKSLATGFQGSIGRDVYKYDMHDGKKFTDLGIEQQARLVEDFVVAREILSCKDVVNASIGGRDLKEALELNGQKMKACFPAVSLPVSLNPPAC
ncbi:MAG: hypothetical protein ACAH83_20250 [Alphaproteobacteria bacterium]